MSNPTIKQPRLLRDEVTGLYRVRWPDGAVSDFANLSRCHDAAREWVEREIMTEHAAGGRRRALKSLKKIRVSSPPIARNRRTLPRVAGGLQNAASGGAV